MSHDVDWTIDYEPYATLPASNDFEQRYAPPTVMLKEKEVVVVEEVAAWKENGDEEDQVPRKRGRATRVSTKLTVKEETSIELAVKEESMEWNDDEPAKKKRGRSTRGSVKLPSKEEHAVPVPIKEEAESIFSDAAMKNGKRGRAKSVTRVSLKAKLAVDTPVKYDEDANDDLDPTSDGDEKIERPTKKRSGRRQASLKSSAKTKKQQNDAKVKASTGRSRKRKITVNESNSDEEVNPDENHTPQQEDSPMEETHSSVRRSSRARKAPAMEPTSVLAQVRPTLTADNQVLFESSPQAPRARTKRAAVDKRKVADVLTVATNTKSSRSRRRRKTNTRRNSDTKFCLSTSSSEDMGPDYLSDEDDDIDDEELYPASQSDDNLFALEEDNTCPGEELRTAKTAQASTIVTACCACAKSDRPDVLLLCDDCDDAYHIHCLRPVLLSVPDGDWFCPLCEHKKLCDQLIVKLKDLFVHYHDAETKRAGDWRRRICRANSDARSTAATKVSRHRNLNRRISRSLLTRTSRCSPSVRPMKIVICPRRTSTIRRRRTSVSVADIAVRASI